MSKINQNQNATTTTNRVGTSTTTTTTTTTNGGVIVVDLQQQQQQQISNDLSGIVGTGVSGGGLSTFQTQLNPLNAYNPDLSAGNGGPLENSCSALDKKPSNASLNIIGGDSKTKDLEHTRTTSVDQFLNTEMVSVCCFISLNTPENHDSTNAAAAAAAVSALGTTSIVTK